ncbi:MAG: ATP-binding protein [Candidatus Methylomirabilia bacterium]
MGLHKLLPLIALLLNVSLAGISLHQNPRSRLNRVFAYVVSGLALWNFGVFMLRRAPDEASAYFWEIIIHVGVILLPAFYYHFVLIFLDSTTRHRPSLILAYAGAAVFAAINLSGTPLFMKGVKWTFWGWAPASGPLYLPFFVYFNAFLICGLYRLMRGYKEIESSFRRNRAALILLGTFVSLAGGFVDFTRFILARSIPVADQIYPVGIPVNMLFALMLGISIVRYRLFDVSVAVKKGALYGAVCVIITALLVLMTRTMELYFNWRDINMLWVVVPLGFVITLLMSPLGQRLEELIQRVMFSRQRGCYETLLELTKRMSGILDFRKLVETLVQGLVQGIPVTHGALLVYDERTKSYVNYREETATGEEGSGVSAIRAASPIVTWLRRTGQLLVKDEVQLNPEIAAALETAEGELEEIRASLLVPVKIEQKLIGILLLGEKLSGEIFDNQELEVISLVANQAAISTENAGLYEEVGRTNAQLLQANRLKSEFLASMSHELRTPLNSIIGFSKVLLKRIPGELTERQETYVRSVHNSSTHLLQLISDILDISRIEAGRIEMYAEELDLRDLIEECFETSVPLVRGKAVKIEKDVPLELPRLHADRTKVRQILLNLLSNAVKFTPSGKVLLRVQPEPETVRVSVADTGIGIPQHDLPRLFEPFQRVENPLAREAAGTGLGLAISKKFVEMHGGHIWVETREKQGSTFHFTLPLAQPAH